MAPIEATAPERSQRPTARLRVAYVYRHFARSGSIASLYVRTAERLTRDVDVTAVCATGDRAQTDTPVRFVDVEPVVTGTRRISFAIECHTFARRATRAVQREPARYDVVHSEGFACLWADVVTAHAVRQAEVEHYFRHVEPRAGIRGRLSPALLRPQVRVVVDIEKQLFAPLAPLVICPSQRVKGDLERWHGVPGELVDVIPYGIDVAGFGHDAGVRASIREREGVADDTVVVLAVADEFERKGIARLIDALGRCASSPELWVIGGDDPSRYRARAASAGVADRVRFLGRRPFEELAGWYAACDVMAVVSRQDSWAIPVLEGMAAGRTVLASEFAGSNEAIVSGNTGFVVRGEGDSREIAALLDGPLADPTLRRTVGARAAAEARRYDVGVAHAALLDVYARAAQRRRERPVPRLDERRITRITRLKTSRPERAK